MSVDSFEDSLGASAAVAFGEAQADGVRRQVRGSTLLLAGQFLSLGLAFVTQVVVVRYLSKTGYGAFAYALSLVAIAQTAITFGVNRSVARVVPMFRERGDRASASDAIVVALGVIFVLGVSLMLVVAGLHGLFLESLVADRTARTVLLTLIVLAPIQAIDDLLINLFAVFHRVRSIFFRTYVLAPALRLVAALVMIAIGGTARTLALGFVVAGVVGLLVYAPILVRVLQAEGFRLRIPRHGQVMPFAPILTIAAPLFAADLAYVVMTSADAVLLGHFRGAADVASFKAVQPAARLNEIVFGSFLVLFTPLAARLFARNDRAGLSDLYWQTAAWITVMSFPIFAVTFALADPFVNLLFGSRYADSGLYLSILSVGFYVQAAFGFNGTAIIVFGRVRYIVVLSVMAITTNLCFNLVLIPRYGALGAAIGTAASLALYNVFKQVALQLATGIPMFDRSYLGVYLSVGAGVASLALLQRGLSLGLLPSLAVVVLASITILTVNRRRLRTAGTFPELGRLPFVSRVFGGGQ